MANSSKFPVLLIGGSGIVGVRAARALRKLTPDLPIAIAGRDATKAAAVAADVGGPTTSLAVDLKRDDLALPASSAFSAVLVFVKDLGMRTMRYAQDKGIPYVAFSDFAFDIAPAIGLFVARTQACAHPHARACRRRNRDTRCAALREGAPNRLVDRDRRRRRHRRYGRARRQGRLRAVQRAADTARSSCATVPGPG